MEPNIPSPVCRKDGVEIHAAVPKDITEAFSVIAIREPLSFTSNLNFLKIQIGRRSAALSMYLMRPDA